MLRFRKALLSFFFLSAVISLNAAPVKPTIPDDFPRFIVPGQEKVMESLRQLYYLHYVPGGPLATLWDDWMTAPTLWPAVTTDNRMNTIRDRWSAALTGRIMDPEGYVATHQHPSLAHQLGWPFPTWWQGQPDLAWGWHFGMPATTYAWGGKPKNQDGWEIHGAKDAGIANNVWNLELTSPSATIITPPLSIDPYNSPFIQIRWKASGLEKAQPYLEWTTEESPAFNPERRMFFDPIKESDGVFFTMIPVHRSPSWKGKITRLRINFDNLSAAKVGVEAVFTQYDTRHTINNPNFIRGCCNYFNWTRDLNFLRANIERMRLAQLYIMDEHGARKEKCIAVPWVGHDGRTGIEITPEGKKIVHKGRAIGNNYWDLLPMGYKDAYGTIHYYNSLLKLAELEEEIGRHPEWNMPTGPLRIPPEELRNHANEVKTYAGKIFWNDTTGRFVSGIDIDGRAYDYGFTFINLDAIAYDFATAEQAAQIMSWIAGTRTVETDTSKGEDIYHWRFGPRSTTLRNIKDYFWGWTNPETIAFGDQVQDGGCVLGWSLNDLLSRIRVLGPGDAWARLKQITAWFDEVQAAGGYREYYKDGTRGKLQGGNVPGGLGLDQEFFESILVPQVMLDGFLGFKARADGFEISPNLPGEWPELTITRVHLHRSVIDLKCSNDSIQISGEGPPDELLKVYLPGGRWKFNSSHPTMPGKALEGVYDFPTSGISVGVGSHSTSLFQRITVSHTNQ